MLKKGINCVAITDHNTIEGALWFKEYSKKINVIIGEEIFTDKGEIIGLFLEKNIEPGLSPEETVYQIKEQGGIVYIPHPFDKDRIKSCLELEKILSLQDEIDIIETFNSRTRQQKFNDKAYKLCKELNKISAVGSDSHTVAEIGRSYQIIDPFNTPYEFLKNLMKAKQVSEPSPKIVHQYTRVAKRLKKLFV
ncbi:PHP domain-containing protein [Geobacillus stearothermophilus]|nr:PHP domain-containing protein [Geobacillus stearothermophilus]RLQ06282.1 PHP domain-containing protein [Geobacillus stearothermophilus]